MDITLIIGIIIALAVVYFFIKLIVSPILKVIIGIAIFLATIYLLQRFLGFNFNEILAPLGISFAQSKWGLDINQILEPINYYLEKIKIFLNFFGKKS